jgi:predicted nucleotide-binding protein
MKGVPARRPSTPPPPQPSVLKLPLSDAEAQLTARIEAGRELIDADAASLETQLASMPYRGGTINPLDGSIQAPRGTQEVRTLRRKAAQWRDFNRTWLNIHLGGEAAKEYEDASTHWSFGGSDDPRLELGFLRGEIEEEVSKLESIRDRLPMWEPHDDVTSASTPASSQSDDSRATTFATNRKAVMVIYGHDTQANTALFDWLRAIGLQPQEWSQIMATSGSASPYIGQALERAFENAQAVVAFFTPDERVLAANASPDNPNAWRLQARPNVLIEAGMALTIHPTRTVLVMLGPQELPSDLAGRHYVRLTNTAVPPLHDLANRLHLAGCDTDTLGTSWLDPARFPERDHITPAPPTA